MVSRVFRTLTIESLISDMTGGLGIVIPAHPDAVSTAASARVKMVFRMISSHGFNIESRSSATTTEYVPAIPG